ncbi:MAG: hypothetical protein HYY79_04005 [Betaproteobacteria bacterium]|nr:hypothetical protein [Betaproteobacteria bacterium]
MKTPRSFQLLSVLGVVVVAIVLDRAAAYFSGIERVLPDLAGEGVLLLAWAIGHCDTLDGSVVTAARKALETGNVNHVLPWVRSQDEPEIRHAFKHAMSVRKLGPQARQLADTHFFETLVRVHRASEGAPYTGLKPAGSDLGPAAPAADQALEDGSVDAVMKLLTDAVRVGVRQHFHAAMSRRNFALDDVAAGREYVEAYVPYVHYIERLWDVATGAALDHPPEHSAHEHQHSVHVH